LEPISHNVRYFRKLRGMTQAELAKAAGTTQYTVSEIELAHREPHPATLRKLAAALGIRVADFYGEREGPLAEALPSQDPLFNGGSQERGAFIERCKRYVAARVAHYENRLAESGGVFADYDGVKTLRDEAFEEFSRLIDLQGGELTERWLDDPEVPEAVKEDLGFALVEAQKPFIQVVGRIGDREVELAPTPYEKDKAERRHSEVVELAERRRQKEKEARRDHKSKTA